MKLRHLKNVAKIKIITEKCTGCGICIDVCPQEVIEIANGKAFLIDKDACMECGACGMNCPFASIDVKSGVGCTSAIISGWINGTEPNCDCSGGGSSGCC